MTKSQSRAVEANPESAAHLEDSKIAEHSGLLSMSGAVIGVLSYSCTLLMANALLPTEYSHFAAAQTLLGMVGIVTSALVPLPLAHAVATHLHGSEARRDGMAFAVMVSFLAGLVAALVTGLVTLGFASPTMAGVVGLSALVLFMGASPSGWLQGELRFVRYSAKSVCEVSARVLFSVLVVVLFWGAIGAVFGFVVGGCLALFVVPKSFYRDLSWRPQVLKQIWRWRETADIALTLCVVSALVGADVVVITFLDGGSSEAAGFQALASIAKAPVYVAAGTVLVAFPLLRAPGVRSNDVLSAALRSFGKLAIVAFAIIATVPHDLVALILPQRYHDSLVLLPWLALSGLGYASVTVFTTVLLALRAYRRCQLGLIFASILVPSGLLLGWQMNGVTGLAIGCAVGSSVAAAVLIAISYRFLPPISVRTSVKALSKIAGLGVVLMLAGLQPIIWLGVVLVIGLAVLFQQRASTPAGLGIPKYLRRWAVVLVPAFHRTRARAGQIWGAWGRFQMWRPYRVPASDGSLRRRVRHGFFSAKDPPLEHRLLHPSALEREHDPQTDDGRSRNDKVAHFSVESLKSFTVFVVITAGALGVRSIGLMQGFELWMDEILYAQLGQSAATGAWPQLPDGPFFLHPPGFFLLEGGVINIFSISGGILNVVMDLRWLNALLGAISVGIAFLLVQKVGNRTTAWITAVLLTFDPFVLRNNSHVFLETLGMAAVLGGLLLVVVQLTRQSTRPSSIHLICAGLLMGYGILTKDFFVICTIAPVVIVALWRPVLRLCDSVVLVSAMLVPYVLYLGTITVQGMFPNWLSAKVNGAVRLIGLDKSTGFTATGSPSFISRLIDQIGHFGTSYLLLAIGPVAAAIVCFSPRPERRLIGLACLALGGFGLYSAVFGTFEEQYGYGVIIASVLSLAVLVTEIIERRPKSRRTLCIIGACFAILTVTLGLRTETTVDNGFAQAEQWVQANLPSDAKVSVTNGTGELLFQDDKRFGVWPSAPLMQKNGVNYILTQSLPTSQGYGYARPAMLTWLASNATPLFSAQGPTNGATTIWFVGARELEQGARAGVGAPAANAETAK